MFKRKVSGYAAWALGALLCFCGVASATIYCPAGFYCNKLYDRCIERGEMTEYGCWLQRERCYQDACRGGG